MIHSIEQIVMYRLLKVRAGSQIASFEINSKSENYPRISTAQLSPIMSFQLHMFYSLAIPLLLFKFQFWAL